MQLAGLSGPCTRRRTARQMRHGRYHKLKLQFVVRSLCTKCVQWAAMSRIIHTRKKGNYIYNYKIDF